MPKVAFSCLMVASRHESVGRSCGRSTKSSTSSSESNSSYGRTSAKQGNLNGSRRNRSSEVSIHDTHNQALENTLLQALPCLLGPRQNMCKYCKKCLACAGQSNSEITLKP